MLDLAKQLEVFKKEQANFLANELKSGKVLYYKKNGKMMSTRLTKEGITITKEEKEK